jgi:hypothetical protein
MYDSTRWLRAPRHHRPICRRARQITFAENTLCARRQIGRCARSIIKDGGLTGAKLRVPTCCVSPVRSVCPILRFQVLLASKRACSAHSSGQLAQLSIPPQCCAHNSDIASTVQHLDAMWCPSRRWPSPVRPFPLPSLASHSPSRSQAQCSAPFLPVHAALNLLLPPRQQQLLPLSLHPAHFVRSAVSSVGIGELRLATRCLLVARR